MERGLLSRAQLEAALVEQGRTRRVLGSILVARGIISASDLSSALVEQLGLAVNSREPRSADRLLRFLRRSERVSERSVAAPEVVGQPVTLVLAPVPGKGYVLLGQCTPGVRGCIALLREA
jgi:hypothetical protein